MNLMKRLSARYWRWRFAHATPAQRGEMLHRQRLPGHYRVGEGCEFLTPAVPLGSEPYLVEIGNRVRITAGVRFCTHDGGMWVLRQSGMMEDAEFFAPIRVEDNVHIGWNAIILPGVTIGHDSIIGAGAVVTHDIPPRSVAAGVPARVIRSIDDYAARRKTQAVFTKHMDAREKEAYLRAKFGEG